MMSTAALGRGHRDYDAIARRRARYGIPALLAPLLAPMLGPMLAALLSLSACGGSGTPQRRTLIDSRDNYDPRSLDPALSTDVPTGRAVSYLFDGLTRFTPQAQVMPDLATSWDLASDGITYTFHLKRGVKFHDGSSFTASDVRHSWERVLDPRTKGGRGWPLYPIRGAKEFAAGTASSISGLEIVDDTTVRISLTEPFAIFPKMLAMPATAMVPKVTPENFGEHPIGTGPWKFVSWHHDDYLLFARNANYHDGAPLADSLEARIIPELSTAEAEFEAGNVDVFQVPAQESPSWESNDETRGLLQSAPSLRLIYGAINMTRGPLRDARVRQAINLAVDRRMILRRLMGGRGTLAAGVIPPSLDGYDSTLTPFPYDTLRARELLRQAGYPNGIDIELWTSQSEQFPRIAQTIQAYLGKVGIRVKLVQRDASSMREAARNGKTDIALKDWYADYPDAENFLYPLLHTANRGVGGNVSFFSDSAFDSVVSAARREPDDAKRIALYRQANAMAHEQAPMLFMFFYTELYAVQPWLKGFTVPSIFTGERWTRAHIVRPVVTK
ncbi:MAG: ABC transporter substrate-binding protein [Gemmatimonadota bacterium]|nr:ABC transporter substrate-binding protein [Gemmatimonadota bacterium]